MSDNRKLNVKRTASAVLIAAAAICCAVLVIKLKKGSPAVGKLSAAAPERDTTSAAETATETVPVYFSDRNSVV